MFFPQQFFFKITDPSRPLTDRHEICTQVWLGGQVSKSTFEKLSPSSKNYVNLDTLADF